MQKFGVCSSRLGLFGGFVLVFYFQRDSLIFAVLFLYFSGLQHWAPTLSCPLCLVRLFLPHVVPGGERSAGAKPYIDTLSQEVVCRQICKPHVINCHIC